MRNRTRAVALTNNLCRNYFPVLTALALVHTFAARNAAGGVLMGEEFRVLYETYRGVVRGRCVRILGNSADAEDATQEAFLRAALHGIDASSLQDPLPWMLRVATNCAITQMRSRKRQRRKRGAAREVEMVAPPGVGGESQLADRDFARRLMRKLPREVGASVWLHHVDGMSHDEIGRALGLSRRTVFTYLADFRQRLRKLLAREQTLTRGLIPAHEEPCSSSRPIPSRWIASPASPFSRLTS